MSELSPALFAELQTSRPLLFGWCKIVFPNYTLRLLDGSATVVMGGETYVGRDSTYGVLDSVGGLEDKIDGKAPAVTLGLIPASDAALSAFLDPNVQGSPVSIGIGAVNMLTGYSVDAGYTLFTGFLDVPTVTWSLNNRRLSYSCTSIGERLFNIEEGRRLSDAFHQQVWPGETGFFAVTEVEQTVYWGMSTPAAAVTTSGSATGFNFANKLQGLDTPVIN